MKGYIGLGAMKNELDFGVVWCSPGGNFLAFMDFELFYVLLSFWCEFKVFLFL